LEDSIYEANLFSGAIGVNHLIEIIIEIQMENNNDLAIYTYFIINFIFDKHLILQIVL